jgi:RNA polymerase primary sigma factor
VEKSEQSSLDIYLKQISVIPLITVQEEIDLAKKISKGDEKAREKMITANLRFGRQNRTRLFQYRAFTTRSH